jgi:hypothetical protein
MPSELPYLIVLVFVVGILAKAVGLRRRPPFLRIRSLRFGDPVDQRPDARSLCGVIASATLVALMARHVGAFASAVILLSGAAVLRLATALTASTMRSTLGHIGVAALLAEVGLLGGAGATTALSGFGLFALIGLWRIRSR